MQASFYKAATIVATDGMAVLHDLGRGAPTELQTAHDLGIVSGVAARRTAAGIAYAERISDLGGTDLWTELANSHDLRTSAGGGGTSLPSTSRLLEMARELVVPRWKGVQDAVGRPRPFTLNPALQTTLHRPTTTSFPSGHATGAYLGATILATLDPANAARYWAAAADTARSRVYGGVHFPSDVEVGAQLGHRAAAEVLAQYGITAAKLQLPAVRTVRAFDSFGLGSSRDAVAALADLRLPYMPMLAPSRSGVPSMLGA